MLTVESNSPSEKAPKTVKRSVGGIMHQLQLQLWLPLPTLASKNSIARAELRRVPHTMQTSANFSNSGADKNLIRRPLDLAHKEKEEISPRATVTNTIPEVAVIMENRRLPSILEPGSLQSNSRVIPRTDSQKPRTTIRNTQIIVSWVVVGSDPLH